MLLYIPFMLTSFLKDEQFTEFVQFLAKYQTDSGFRNLAFEYTLVIFIVKQTDITGSGSIQTIFQRDVINKGFRIIRRTLTCRNLTADYNLETIVKETL